MISQDKAREIALEWIDAWNSHGLDAIMSHYSDDIVLTSPIAVKLLGDESGVVAGKDALRAYFKKGLAAFPDLRFELLGVFACANSIVLHYTGANGRPGAEPLYGEHEAGKVIAGYDYSK